MIKTKLLFRKIKNQFAIFMSAVFIVLLAVLFFVAVKTVYRDFKTIAEKYFKDNNLDDLVLFGNFDEDDIKKIEDIDGIDKIELRHRYQGKLNSIDAIIYGDYYTNNINKAYIYEGKRELETNEIAINKNFAIANNLTIDDEVNLELFGITNTFKIASIVSYPNYVFLFKDGASTASNPEDFAVVEMHKDNFTYLPYNSIYITYKDNIDRVEVEKEIRGILKKKIFSFTDREQSVNYINFEQTLLQIDSFAYICPSILLLMAILLLYIIQRRNVAVERKQIGIMKAIGLTDTSILFMYIKYSFVVSFFGILLAFIASKFLLKPIFASLVKIFDIPNFTYSVYVDLWIISTIIILLVCILSNLLAATSILKLNPAQSMRGEPPKDKGKKIFIEKMKFWNKLSFNTRYSIKNASRSKTRYLASLWGMFAAISMTIFAQGFNNSFDYFLDNLYHNFVLYDSKVFINPSKKEDINFLSDDKIKKYDLVSIYQSKITSTNSDKSFYLPFLIYDEESFSSLDISFNEEYKDSVMIPEYIAKKLGVEKDDYIDIELYTFGDSIIKTVRVSTFVKQQGMFFVYISDDFYKSEFENIDTYNSIFITKNDDTSNDDMKKLLDDSSLVSLYSFRNDEYEANKQQIATIYLLVQILVFVAFLLGAISLYGVGVITLATRRYEFTLLKVMGYTTKEIMIASFKEIITQIIIAVPIGILSGYGILYLVKKPFSSKLFSFEPHIYSSSYIFAIVLLIVVVFLVSILSSHYIDKLDMVEGLKDRED